MRIFTEDNLRLLGDCFLVFFVSACFLVAIHAFFEALNEFLQSLHAMTDSSLAHRNAD
jgi:hypothetical protein